MGKAAQKSRHPHAAGRKGPHSGRAPPDFLFFHQIRQEKAEQDQPADRDKIQLNARGKKSRRAPADRCAHRLQPFPQDPEPETEEHQPVSSQRHVHRHLGQQDRRKDKQKAAHRGLGLFPHIMMDQKGGERSLQQEAHQPPKPEILELLRQDPPEELEEYRKKRHRIRKDHRYLIGPGHPVHQPDRKGPRAVPEKAPAKIMLGQVPASQQPVRIGNIQHMYPVNT